MKRLPTVAEKSFLAALSTYTNTRVSTEAENTFFATIEAEIEAQTVMKAEAAHLAMKAKEKQVKKEAQTKRRQIRKKEQDLVKHAKKVDRQSWLQCSKMNAEAAALKEAIANRSPAQCPRR
jgi:hypothetical protein